MVSFQMIYKLMLVLTMVSMTTAFFIPTPDDPFDCPQVYSWSGKYTTFGLDPPMKVTMEVQNNHNDFRNVKKTFRRNISGEQITNLLN